MKNKLLLAASVCVVLATAIHPSVSISATEQNKASEAILLQGFHWNSHDVNWYNVIESNATSVKNLGATHVWFPPSSDAASDEGYLPRKLEVLDSQYGSKQQLKSAIRALENEGVKSVADIVVNHRVGTTDWADFTMPTWGSWAVTCGDEWPGATGNCDSGDSYDAARDLDHTNRGVRDGIIGWLRNTMFNDAGFSGIRYDYSKGYAPYYAGLYAREVNPNFCVGEVWTDLDYNNTDAHRQLLIDYVNGADGDCGIFDFTTKGILNQALASNEHWRLSVNGQPAGGIGWWSQKMVTFVDNHDTGPSESCGTGQEHWPVPCDQVMQGYAYVLTHPGIPTVYWPHAFDWGLYDDIKALIDIRKQAGVTSMSPVSIQVAEQGLYAAKIGDNVAMKIGYKNWQPSGSGWNLASSGTNYAVWTKTAPPSNFERTVVFIYGQTSVGQDLFIRGGIDHNYAQANLGRNCTAANYECAIPIEHNNLRNITTAPWKAGDNFLDWYGVESSQGVGAQGTAADWTTNIWPANWGDLKTVETDGFGLAPLNTFGSSYWMLDVQMDCSKTANGWFEIKTFITNGPGWEADVSQPNTPYVSGNHFARCGMKNVFRRGESAADITNL